MNSRNALIVLGFVFILLLNIFAFAPIVRDLSGRVTEPFSASVTVADITIPNTFTQNITPTTGGSDVRITIQITYGGTGVVNITRSKPGNFTNGFDWEIIEDGRTVSVNDLGDNLQWLANNSASTIYLNFTVNPPTISTVNETAGTVYDKYVNVGAVNHFYDVSASTSANTGFSNFSLYLVNGTQTDVTTLYNFTVSNGIARWFGFNLSTKQFRISGTGDSSTENDVVSGSGDGGGDRYSPDENTSFTLDPTWIEDTFQEGETQLYEVTIQNRGDTDFSISMVSNVPFIHVPEQAAVTQDGITVVPITVDPLEPGEHFGTVTFTSEGEEKELFLDLQVTPRPQQETPGVVEEESTPPPVVSPQKSTLPSQRAINSVLLLLLLVLYGAWMVYHVKRER